MRCIKQNTIFGGQVLYNIVLALDKEFSFSIKLKQRI